ncbi:MAG: D-alanyl-D-alanine carboxypeptidase [Gammaproteobacteria bacterium]|jgi:D-alanyl-D-alanine carboxypeptidase (penicillin-binding protein 5/6)|nr:D-alanyl-D-alanine carboxypeptidase [Gammaproteobacteria bacterium]
MMFNVLVRAAMVAILVSTGLLAGAAPALIPAPPQLQATGWILMDAATGTVLAEHNADEALPPASLVKIMTDYILANELAAGRISLDDEVLISEKAWRQGGSKMFVHVGDRVRVEDLARGIIIQSGNDASIAIAEFIAGSEDAFVQMMNAQAELLGMVNTQYRNSTGWPDPEQYSSPRDQAILAKRLIADHPEHYAIYAEREFTYGRDFQTGAPIVQRNRNSLLWMDQTVDGVKTGHTEAAGYCLVASAQRDGMRLISVLMGSDSTRSRARDSQALLRYGFRFFETRSLYAGLQQLERTAVWKGKDDEVSVGLAEDVVLTLPRGRYDDLKATVVLDPWLSAPIAEGTELGTLSVTLDDDEIFSAALIALAAVERAGIVKRLWHSLQMFFTRLFS